MSLAKIIWIISALAAIVFAFMSGMSQAAMLLAVLGLISGWFVHSEHRVGVIVAAIFLALAGGANAWNALPAIGDHVTAIMANWGAVLAAASLMIVLKTFGERVKP